MVVDLTNFPDIAGVCDLLRAVTASAALAESTGDTQLSIKHNPQHGCPDHLCDLIGMTGFEVRRWKETDGNVPLQLNSFTSYPHSQRAQEILDTLNPGEITHNAFYRSWRRHYQSIQPNARAVEMVDALNLPHNYLGVHLRLTDKVRGKTTFSAYRRRKVPALLANIAETTRQICRSRNCDIIFVACDEERSKNEFVQLCLQLGLHAITCQGKFSTEAFRQTSGLDFMADLVALSRSETIVGSLPSGIPPTARLMQGRSLDDIVWGRFYYPLLGSFLNRQLWRARRRLRQQNADHFHCGCPTCMFSGTTWE